MSRKHDIESDKQMNSRDNMIIIKNEIKTPEILSCKYNADTKKMDVKFNNGKTYSYAYLNVQWKISSVSFRDRPEPERHRRY